MSTIDLPQISVIIPTYNRRDQVQIAIKSVLEQTYKKIEIIVVDGPSDDGTREVINNINNSKIRYVRNDSKSGAPEARNIGAKKANGDYIAFLDSDDYWMPSKLEKQVEIIKKSGSSTGAVYCDYYTNYVDVDSISKNGRSLNHGDMYDELLSGKFYLITSVLLIRRNVFIECGGFDSELPYFEDYDLCLKIAKKYEISVVDLPLVIKNVGYSDSLSQDNDIKIQGLYMMMDRWGAEMTRSMGPSAIKQFTNDRLARYLFFKCIDSVREDDRKQAFYNFVEYLRQTPIIKPKHIAYFSCSFIGGSSIEEKLMKYYTIHKK